MVRLCPAAEHCDLLRQKAGDAVLLPEVLDIDDLILVLELFQEIIHWLNPILLFFDDLVVLDVIFLLVLLLELLGLWLLRLDLFLENAVKEEEGVLLQSPLVRNDWLG